MRAAPTALSAMARTWGNSGEAAGGHAALCPSSAVIDCLPSRNQIFATGLMLCQVRSQSLMRISHIPRLAEIALATFMAASVAPAAASVVVTIDKSTQRMTVEVDNHLRWIWPVSTGQLGHDTPNGRYTAFRMEADHFSKEWDDAPMPHSIFFSPTGHAIHGYLNTRRIGSPASHGCVRLEPANAAKLYELVEQQGLPNTKVIVMGDVRLALERRGMPWRYGAEESVATGGPLEGRSYAYWRRVDIPQSAFGYRPTPPRYPSAQSGYGPGYSWRLHRY